LEKELAMLKRKQGEKGLCDIKAASTKEQEQFHKRVVSLNAIACSFHKGESDNGAKLESQASLNALNAGDGLQEMLAAQMLSIHQLQQMANGMAFKHLADNRYGQYFINTTVKLANTFVQQANLLSKLQGDGQQRIVVERVDVHQGGQAVVGNVNAPSPGDKVKK
jgi:hypothetical protein